MVCITSVLFSFPGPIPCDGIEWRHQDRFSIFKAVDVKFKFYLGSHLIGSSRT